MPRAPIILAGILVLAAAALWLALARPSPATLQPAPPRKTTSAPPPAPAQAPIPPQSQTEKPALPTAPAASANQPRTQPPTSPDAPAPRTASAPAKRQHPPPAPQLVKAREALALVGHDRAAEGRWIKAINDTSFSHEERSDLIEDLNEEGFKNPDHITPDELPIVQRRLDLIDALGPWSMDLTNFMAFAEAKKDLLNIRAELQSENP